MGVGRIPQGERTRIQLRMRSRGCVSGARGSRMPGGGERAVNSEWGEGSGGCCGHRD